MWDFYVGYDFACERDFNGNINCARDSSGVFDLHCEWDFTVKCDIHFVHGSGVQHEIHFERESNVGFDLCHQRHFNLMEYDVFIVAPGLLWTTSPALDGQPSGYRRILDLDLDDNDEDV